MPSSPNRAPEMNYETRLKIGERMLAIDCPSYFIADIAANHDGDLQRAKDLIRRAKDAGADAAKFQHFDAPKIVSDYGFRNLPVPQTHQSKWDKPIFEVYKQYSINNDWNQTLWETAREVGIDWMTTPYDKEATDRVVDLLPAFKIGSGDLTWLESVAHIASKGKPVFLATGASDFAEVEEAVETILAINRQLCLLQCNTNYTGELENFTYINLRVLQTYARHWPGMPLGLSDHTPGHATVLGAIALGARAIEKHFTDDTARKGPDHGFSMDPVTWREMVDRARELENALGDGIKRVEKNELETAIVQRRSIRLKRDLSAGTILQSDHLVSLRPAPAGSIAPSRIRTVLGRRLVRDKVQGSELRLDDLAEAK
jgi:sialic acid synthase SpsE